MKTPTGKVQVLPRRAGRWASKLSDQRVEAIFMRNHGAEMTAYYSGVRSGCSSCQQALDEGLNAIRHSPKTTAEGRGMILTINTEAWRRGFYAGEHGWNSIRCPYPRGTPESFSWFSGHVEGTARRDSIPAAG